MFRSALAVVLLLWVHCLLCRLPAAAVRRPLLCYAGVGRERYPVGSSAAPLQKQHLWGPNSCRTADIRGQREGHSPGGGVRWWWWW